MSSLVYRVNFEVENIGERFSASKIRVTWRFVFIDSETVHTIALEHSRMTARKRVKVDGVQIARQEKYVKGQWTYPFTFEEHDEISFIIYIDDVKKVRKLNTMYRLQVCKEDWLELPSRDDLNLNSINSTLDIKERRKSGGSSSMMWGSESYARKISSTNEQLEENEQRVAWMFTFGRDGDLHHLVLDYHQDGEKHLILDRREIHRTSSTVVQGWSYSHEMTLGHVLLLQSCTTGDETTYGLTINGCLWNDIAETEYELEDGWEPVHSKSTGKVYYRHDVLKETQWTKPIKSRVNAVVSNSFNLPTSQQVPMIPDTLETTPLGAPVNFIDFDTEDDTSVLVESKTTIPHPVDLLDLAVTNEDKIPAVVKEDDGMFDPFATTEIAYTSSPDDVLNTDLENLHLL